MFAWIGAEIGLAVRAANGARTAADAIALAAAARVREGFDASVTDALAAAAANRGPNGPVIVEIGAEPVGGGDVEFGRWDEASRSFVPDPDGGPAVRVRVRFAADHPNGAAGLIFARLFGAGLFAIERTSVAIHNPPRHLTSALVVAPDGVGMDLAGAATVVAWGGLSLASEAAIPLRIAGDAEIDAPVVRVRTALDADTVAAISGTVETVEAIAADPFAAVALPPMGAGDPDQIDHDQLGITVVSPGLHAGLSATGGTVVLGPGIHRFAGPILLGGSAVLSLDGATLRLDDGVGMELTGSAGIAGTPAEGGDWDGFWILQRGNGAIWRIADLAAIAVEGHLYAPTSALRLEDGATVACSTAILGSIEARDAAALEFREDIESLRTPIVPGRARLVR